MRGGRRLKGRAQQVHMRLGDRAAAFVAIARGTRRYQIVPRIHPPQAARHHMIDGEARAFLSAVLAAIIVAPKDFFLGEFDARARPLDHVDHANDAGPRKERANGVDIAATVLDDLGFADEQQTDRAPRVAHVERFEVAIEHQYRLVHSEPPGWHRTANSTDG